MQSFPLLIPFHPIWETGRALSVVCSYAKEQPLKDYLRDLQIDFGESFNQGAGISATYKTLKANAFAFGIPRSYEKAYIFGVNCCMNQGNAVASRELNRPS